MAAVDSKASLTSRMQLLAAERRLFCGNFLRSLSSSCSMTAVAVADEWLEVEEWIVVELD